MKIEGVGLVINVGLNDNNLKITAAERLFRLHFRGGVSTWESLTPWQRVKWQYLARGYEWPCVTAAERAYAAALTVGWATLPWDMLDDDCKAEWETIAQAGRREDGE